MTKTLEHIQWESSGYLNRLAVNEESNTAVGSERNRDTLYKILFKKKILNKLIEVCWNNKAVDYAI